MAKRDMKQFVVRLRHDHKPVAIWDMPSVVDAEKKLATGPSPDRFEVIEDRRFSIEEWDAIVDRVVDNMPERNWKISKELRQRLWAIRDERT